MGINQPNFNDYVYRSHENLNNLFESYFYLEGISGKLGAKKFKVIDDKKDHIKLEDSSNTLTMMGALRTTAKLFSYLTLVVPAAMLAGKWFLRNQHHYKILNEISAQKTDEAARKKWREYHYKPAIPHQTEAVETKKLIQEKQLISEKNKERSNAIVNDGLDTIHQIKKFIETNDSRVSIVSRIKNSRSGNKEITGYIEGRFFRKIEYPQYKMTTWNFEKDGQQFEINEFDKGAYHSVKTEGFIMRHRVLIDAARKYVAELKIKDPQKKELVKNQIEEILIEVENDFLDKIWEHKIDPKIIQGSDKAKAEKYYNKIHAHAEKLLAQSALDIQYTINKFSISEDPSKAHFKIESLDQAEKDYMESKGRPICINTFFIPDPDQNFKKFFSMQDSASKVNEKGEEKSRPISPSTARDKIGLANYVQTSFGEVIETDSAPIANTLSNNVRHSSYPPIAIKNPHKRKGIACLNCKENLIDRAASILQVNPNIKTTYKTPLIVPLRTMMILSPKRNIDFFRNHKNYIMGKWTGESETLQMEESALALKIFNQRTFEVQIGNRSIWIKPEITFMNLGSNSMAWAKEFFGFSTPPQSLQNYNAKGFIDFENEVLNFVSTQIGKDKDIKNVLNQISFYNKDPQLIESALALENVKNKNSPKIAALYSSLESCITDYLHASNVEEIEDLKKIMDQIEVKIDILEKEIYSAYRNYFYFKSKIFNSNKEAMIDLFQKTRALLNVKKTKTDEMSKQKLTILSDLMAKMEKAVTLFYSQDYKKTEYIMDFQKHYLDINQMMFNFIEFFCKSGEDRTGRLDDVLQENVAFEATVHRPPTSKEDQEYIDTVIAPLLHQFSASQNNTEYNSGARGEQIGSKINKNLPAKLGKKHAHLAKKIFKKAKKLKPSPWLTQKLESYA